MEARGYVYWCICRRLASYVIISESIEGCTDPKACDYDETANIDDGRTIISHKYIGFINDNEINIHDVIILVNLILA